MLGMVVETFFEPDRPTDQPTKRGSNRPTTDRPGWEVYSPVQISTTDQPNMSVSQIFIKYHSMISNTSLRASNILHQAKNIYIYIYISRTCLDLYIEISQEPSPAARGCLYEHFRQYDSSSVMLSAFSSPGHYMWPLNRPIKRVAAKTLIPPQIYFSDSITSTTTAATL